MNEAQIKGKWKQIKGDIKRQWGKLTDDQIDQAEGRFDKLTGQIQEAYGKNLEDAREEVESFRREHNLH